MSLCNTHTHLLLLCSTCSPQLIIHTSQFLKDRCQVCSQDNLTQNTQHTFPAFFNLFIALGYTNTQQLTHRCTLHLLFLKHTQTNTHTHSPCPHSLITHTHTHSPPFLCASNTLPLYLPLSHSYTLLYASCHTYTRPSQPHSKHTFISNSLHSNFLSLLTGIHTGDLKTHLSALFNIHTLTHFF